MEYQHQQQQHGIQPAPEYTQQPPGTNSKPHPYGQLPSTPQGYQQQDNMRATYTESANVRNQKWENSLCNCAPCGSCLLGTFLPCMLLGKTSERMRDPTMRNYQPINVDCMLMCGITYFTCCGWIYAMIKRGEIRERFHIEGSGLRDCCTTYWCPCCALIQQDKEVARRLATEPIAQEYQGNKEGMNMNRQV
ncbi:hypothetical protein D7B24_006167 [Verticillium nonalfalfae]|uniref:Uncharacterized protein n=1 Tax=Verticillium nonalfalfae TaxID=1051616 RepID=A0A3M9YAK3_9PEZI|nr:uncharacterized protein D7B24_006167 [Verticillium nonalfalfae]RNJ57404.1 hypothetical protein D7B24_006167 [Verticillium nonalfalfae]